MWSEYFQQQQQSHQLLLLVFVIVALVVINFCIIFIVTLEKYINTWKNKRTFLFCCDGWTFKKKGETTEKDGERRCKERKR